MLLHSWRGTGNPAREAFYDDDEKGNLRANSGTKGGVKFEPFSSCLIANHSFHCLAFETLIKFINILNLLVIQLKDYLNCLSKISSEISRDRCVI